MSIETKKSLITMALALIFGLYLGYVGLTLWEVVIAAVISGAAISINSV